MGFLRSTVWPPKNAPHLPTPIQQQTNLIKMCIANVSCQLGFAFAIKCHHVPSFNTMRLSRAPWFYSKCCSYPLVQHVVWVGILMDAASRAAVVEVADIAPWVCWHCSTGTFSICLMSNEIKLFHSDASCVQALSFAKDTHVIGQAFKRNKVNIHSQIFLHKSPATTAKKRTKHHPLLPW